MKLLKARTHKSKKPVIYKTSKICFNESSNKGMRKRFSSTRGFLPTPMTKRRRRNMWIFLLILFVSSFVAFTSCAPENEFMSTSSIASYSDDANGSTATAAALQHRHHHNNRQQRQQQRDHENFAGERQSQNFDDDLTGPIPGNKLKRNQNAASEVAFDESSLPNGFWIRVAQAKAMALMVEHEVLPKLDPLSQIMLRADCGIHGDSACKEFVTKCAENQTSMMIKDILEKRKRSISNQIPFYMNEIWRKCGINSSHFISPGFEVDVNFASDDTPKPAPVFHCNAHVGKNKFETNYRMEYPETIAPPKDFPSELIPRYFVIETKEHPGNWELNSVQPFWVLRFGRKMNDTFQIRVTAVSPKYIYPPVVSDPITLYDSSIQTTGKPVNLTVVNMTVDKAAARPLPSAILRWNSGSGLNASCDFDVFYMDEDDMHKVERKKPDEAFWVRLDSLHFGKNYIGKIIEKFGGDRESDILNYSLHIPSCLELRGFSFELCPPPPPSNVRLVNATDNSFWIKWDPPKYMNSTNRILSYNLTVEWVYTQSTADGVMHSSKMQLMHLSTQKIFSGSVSGNVTAVEIKNVTNLRGQFKVFVTAIGSSGPSPPSGGAVIYKVPALNAWTAQKILTLFFALFGVAVLVGLFCLLKNFHEKRERKKKRQEKFENYEKESLQLSQCDKDAMKWEIDSCSLTLGDAIGQGFFGLVRRATLNRRGRKITVAVKTLRDGVDEKDVEKFWEEFEILKELDPHVHVVGLKGIVTKHVPLPLLVVEYCDGGNLQTYLRKAVQSPSFREKYYPGSTVSSGSSIVNLSSENRAQVQIVQNEAYFMKNEIETPCPQLDIGDLLSYARQIACGMEYLSTNKIVHRDLAARNILIQSSGNPSGKQKILKISDFGLSRDVYEKNWYKMSSKGKVPIKWLAIECLLQQLYTTKSDVWSYGILLWEIFTFGGIPYPSADNIKMYDLLKDGYRMSKPELCPEDLYTLMRACWQDDPSERPDFTSIRLILEDIIEKTSQNTYLNLEAALESSCDEDYRAREPILPPRRKLLPQIPI